MIMIMIMFMCMVIVITMIIIMILIMFIWILSTIDRVFVAPDGMTEAWERRIVERIKARDNVYVFMFYVCKRM